MRDPRELLIPSAANRCAELPSLESGLYIYGAGELGTLAVEYCESCQIPIRGILDRQKTGMVTGKRAAYGISKPEDVTLIERSSVPVAVAVVTAPYHPVAASLEALGWRSVFPFYNLTREPRVGHPLCNGWIIGEVSELEISMVSRISAAWADTASRSHYEAYLAWHSDGSEVSLADCPIDPDSRYAISPLLDFLAVRHQQLVDVGSHCGSAVQRLHERGVAFDSYILIEPDPHSRQALEVLATRIRSESRAVTIVSDVVGEFRSSVPFQGGLGYCSQIWAHSSDYREVTPIDDLNLNPDFLKIHTEGSEVSVLKGAQHTVRRCLPALAFSVYHRREGFYRDIVAPMELFAGYRWYFRLHSYQGTGAFVYGIPARSD